MFTSCFSFLWEMRKAGTLGLSVPLDNSGGLEGQEVVVRVVVECVIDVVVVGLT